MSLAWILAGFFGVGLLNGCATLAPQMNQEEVAERFTQDPPGMAHQKLVRSAQTLNVMIVSMDSVAGTFQGTAYRGRVVVAGSVETKGGQTRLGVLARQEPGTFAHGALDLAHRILAAYPEG